MKFSFVIPVLLNQIAIVVSLLAIMPFSANALTRTQPMKLAYFHDFYPYSWQDNKGQMQGLLVDVLTEALHNRMGLTIEHKGFPWARAQKLVKVGKYDAFTTIATPERKTYTQISQQAIIQTDHSIFTTVMHPDKNKFQAINRRNPTTGLHAHTIFGQWLGQTKPQKHEALLGCDTKKGVRTFGRRKPRNFCLSFFGSQCQYKTPKARLYDQRV